jgi:hypothetical protein
LSASFDEILGSKQSQDVGDISGLNQKTKHFGDLEGSVWAMLCHNYDGGVWGFITLWWSILLSL